MAKICIFCKKFEFLNADGSYSDMTPGCEAEIRCGRGIWELDMFSDSEDEYRRKLLTAGSCNLYEQVVLPDGAKID